VELSRFGDPSKYHARCTPFGMPSTTGVTATTVPSAAVSTSSPVTGSPS
jgi:hypothetical protein